MSHSESQDDIDPRVRHIPIIIYDDVASPNQPLLCTIKFSLDQSNPTDVLDFHSHLAQFVFTFSQYDAEETRSQRIHDRLYFTRLTSQEVGAGPDLTNAFLFEPIRAYAKVTLEDILSPAEYIRRPFSFIWLHSNVVPDPIPSQPSSPSPSAVELPTSGPPAPAAAPPPQLTERPSTAPENEYVPAHGTKRLFPPSPRPEHYVELTIQKRRIVDSFPKLTLLQHQPTMKLRGTDFAMRIFVVNPTAKREANISAAALTGEAVRDISQLPARAILLDRSLFAQVVYEIARDVSEKIFLLHHCDYNLMFFLCSMLEVVHGRHFALDSRTYLGQMLISGHSATMHKFDIWRVDLSTLVSAVSSPQSFEDALRTCLVSSFLCFIERSYYPLWKEVGKMAEDGQTFSNILKETLRRITELRSPEGQQVMILVVGYTMAADVAWFMSVAGRTDSIHPSILASALATSLFEPLCAWVHSDVVASVYCFGAHGGLTDEMQPRSTILRSGAVDISHDERVRPFLSVDAAELKCFLLSIYGDLKSLSAAEREQRLRPRIAEIIAYAGGYNSDTGSSEGIRWSWFFEIAALLLAKTSAKQPGFKSYDTLSKKPGNFSRTFCNPEYVPQSLSTIAALMAQLPKDQTETLHLIASNMPYPVSRAALLDDRLRYNDVKPVPTSSSPSQSVDVYPASLATLLKLLIAMGLLIVMPQSMTATDAGVTAASSLSTTSPQHIATMAGDIDSVMSDANADESPVDAAIFDSDESVAAEVTVKAPNSRALAFIHQICIQHRGMLKVDAALEGPDKFGQWAADGIEAHLRDQVTRTIEKINENTFQQLLILLVKLTGTSSAFSVVEELELTDPSSKWKVPTKQTDLTYADIFIPEYMYLAELKVATLEDIKSGVMGWKEKNYPEYDTLKQLDEVLQTMDMTPTPSRAEAHIWRDEEADLEKDFKAPHQFGELTWKDLRIPLRKQERKFMTLDELWHNAHRQLKDYWKVVTIGNIPEVGAQTQKLVSDRRVTSTKLPGNERRSGYRGVMLLVGGRRVVHDVEKVDGMDIVYVNSVVTGLHTP